MVHAKGKGNHDIFKGDVSERERREEGEEAEVTRNVGSVRWDGRGGET